MYVQILNSTFIPYVKGYFQPEYTFIVHSNMWGQYIYIFEMLKNVLIHVIKTYKTDITLFSYLK